MDIEDLKPDLNQKEEQVRKKIQKEIKYCDYDQPYDGGDVVWIYGDKTDLFEIFSNYEISEESVDKIIQHLSCPQCGFSYFELGSNIGLETQYEREINAHVAKANKLFKKEVKDFESFLLEHPFLAFQHQLGKKILNELEIKSLPITSVKGVFFRARKVESSEVINSEAMFTAPKGKPTEGRFNHSGQSHLYIASTKETAIKEVAQLENSMLVWYQKFKIEKSVDDILDLTFDWTNFGTSTSILLVSLHFDNSLGRKDRNRDNWRPDYFITRFIMDCAKKLGYNGIKYNSAIDRLEYDVVLFYPDKLKIRPIGNPSIKIFMNKKERDNFSSDLLDF